MTFVMTQFNAQVKVIRSDNALEFLSDPCKQFFSKHGLLHQTSCVQRPQQNGRVERKHRHILEMARALRFQANLPLKYWGDCVLTAVYIINRLPTPLLQHKTPYEVLFGTLPRYDHLRVFGCLAFTATQHRELDKFQPRGIPCVFLGYSTSQKGYKLLDLSSSKVFVSRDVRFAEHIFPFHDSSSQEYMQPTPVNMVPPFSYDDFLPIPPIQTTVASPTASATPAAADPSAPAEDSTSPTADSLGPAVEVRRSTRAVQKPRWLTDFVTAAVQSSHTQKLLYPAAHQVTYAHLNPKFQAFISALDAQQDPTTFQDAVAHQHWCDAMNTELQALERNGTWSLTKLPKGKKAIGCKWLYKTKYHPDGSIERHKARLVIQGYRQQKGLIMRKHLPLWQK